MYVGNDIMAPYWLCSEFISYLTQLRHHHNTHHQRIYDCTFLAMCWWTTLKSRGFLYIISFAPVDAAENEMGVLKEDIYPLRYQTHGLCQMFVVSINVGLDGVDYCFLWYVVLFFLVTRTRPSHVKNVYLITYLTPSCFNNVLIINVETLSK